MADAKHKLTEWRKRLGLSQADAARKLKCTQGQISQWENGWCKPSVKWTERIEKVCRQP